MPAKFDMELHDTPEKLVTARGKVLRLFKEPGSSLVFLRWEDGGEVPRELKSRFTSVSEALKAGKKYISKVDAIKARRANAKNSG